MSDLISSNVPEDAIFKTRTAKVFSSDGIDLGTDNIGGTDLGLDSHAAVVTARGTEDGLVLRIDGKAEWSSILNELNAFLGGKKRFFQGGEVLVEWLEKLPTKEQTQDLENFLKSNFSIGIQQRKRRLSKLIKTVVDSKVSSLGSGLTTDMSLINEGIDIQGMDHIPSKHLQNSHPQSSYSQNSFGDDSQDLTFSNTSGSNTSGGTAVESLLERVERLSKAESYEGISREGAISFSSDREISLSGSGYVKKVAQYLGEDLLFDEEANARVVFGTMRSGQRIETPFSLIVVGDVNPGADLVAGGDIIVMGSLKGTAHAGAYEDENFEKFIFAMQMQPMQLRIGSVISRGSGESGKGAEVARIDNRSIVVEPYSAKTISKRNRVV